MSHIQGMLKTHPRQSQVDMNMLATCIQACYDCAQSCTACADACLGEQDIQMLIRCIRLNLDCADVCGAMGQMLSRLTEPDWNLLRNQLQACVTACQICSAECEKHAHHHEHCRVCVESCRQCEEACNRLLATMAKA